MKIELNSKPTFTPITITLESRQDVDKMLQIADSTMLSWDPDVANMADGIIKFLKEKSNG